MPKVIRTLTWFDRRTEEMVGEVRLNGATLRALQKLFDIPESDPMYECYPVRAEHLDALQRWADLRINLDKYNYFVEATAHLHAIAKPGRKRKLVSA